MANDDDIIKDHLIADLEQSIEKALDAKMLDLVGSLYRLQGSVRGWCNDEKCGNCALAPLMCINGLNERAGELINKHHAKKPSVFVRSRPSMDHKLPVMRKTIKRRRQGGKKHLKVHTYFNLLHNILSNKAPEAARRKFGYSATGLKLKWQTVQAAFEECGALPA